MPNSTESGPEGLELSNEPVVLTWTNPDLHHLSHTTNDNFTICMHHRVDLGTASFQFRAEVSLKDRRDSICVLLSIPPENIHRLALAEDDGGMALAASSLGTTTRCLRFNLRKAPSLIVPKGDITPRQRSSRIVLDSLRALATQTAFSLHLSAAKTSDAQWTALCAAVTSGSLRSVETFSGVASLYGGKGGRVLKGEELRSFSGPSPPPEPSSEQGGRVVEGAELEPFLGPPPPPPVPFPEQGNQGDGPPSYDAANDAAANAANADPSQATGSGNKRRRSNSDVASSSRPSQYVNVEDMLRKLLARVEDGFGEVGSRLDHMEQRLSDLERRHDEELASIRQVQASSSEQINELRDELEAGLYDVRKETEEIISTQVEDEWYIARANLEDFVKEEMAAVEERFEQKLEEDLTRANVTLEFSWDR